MVPKETIDFSSLEQALASLKQALGKAPDDDLERDGVIQRFEYTFELCWKMIRRVLIALGRAEVSASPRPLLRDAAEEHLIDDIEVWFEFLEARNLTTHTYDQSQAERVFEVAQKFPTHVESLLQQLKEKQR